MTFGPATADDMRPGDPLFPGSVPAPARPSDAPEEDAFLLASLGQFVGDALRAGDAAIIVAGPALRQGLEERLVQAGLDVRGVDAERYVTFDADLTLSRLMRDGRPDRKRFAEILGAAVTRAAAGGRRVRIFGEMVAVLWAEGRYDAALALEQLWNELLNAHPALQLCAYPIGAFAAAEPGPEPAAEGRGGPGVATERGAAPDQTGSRLRAIALLQQRSRALEREVDDRKRAESSLRETQWELTLQLDDLRRLHEMSARLTSTLDASATMEEVLRAAMAVHETDLGLLSLSRGEPPALEAGASAGLSADFVDQVSRLPAGQGACGAAFAERRRVVVEDLDADPVGAPDREAARCAGLRACHSTPLISRAGRVVGVLSVYFPDPHQPSERENRLTDLYARMAADCIENAQLHERLQQELDARAQLLAQAEAARAEAEAASRTKDDFLATVSHELRTPLNAILGWAHLLNRGQLDAPTAARAAATIERNARAQARLVEDILDVSRMIMGKIQLTVGPVDMASVVNAAVDTVQLAAEAKGIRLAVDLDAGSRHVAGDASRLHQVVWNLLSNAIKFTPAGGRVDVRLRRAGPELSLEVADTGEGVPPEFLPFVFDPFRQADGGRTRRHAGLGLGLATARRLVELHGGAVEAQSAGPGCGATFCVRLPSADERALRGPADQQRLRPSDRARTLTGASVLLVDDDEDTLHLLALALTGAGAAVEMAESAAAAARIFDAREPDALVCDLGMPGEDGCSVVRRLRAMEAGGRRRAVAVALTAHTRVEDQATALEAGFDIFVAKPVDPAELVAAVAGLLEARGAER